MSESKLFKSCFFWLCAMRIHHEYLKAKGWSDEEIRHAKRILSRVKRRKHPHHRLLEEALYWGLVLLSLLASIVVALWVLPLIVVGVEGVLYPVLAVIGLSFGVLFTTVMRDLDHLTPRHHAVVVFLIPLTGIVSFFLVSAQVRSVARLVGVGTPSGVLEGFVFSACFLVPYLYHVMRGDSL